MSDPFNLFKRGEIWHASFSLAGKQFRISTRQTREGSARLVARREYQDRLAAILDPAARTLGPFFYEAAEAYVAAGGEARFLPRIVAHFGANVRIGEIDRMKIAEAARALYPDRHPETIRRQLEVPVSAVIRFARGERRRKRHDFARTRWLQPEEAERLIAAADPRTRRMILFLLGTGCRPGEMLALDVAQVYLAQRECLIMNPDPERLATKTGQARWVRLPERSALALDDLPESGAVFRTPKGAAYVIRRNGGGQIAAAFGKARRAAGLDETVTPYTLRHSWATWYEAQTRDFGGLMDRGGWAKPAMAMRYRKLAPPDLAERLLDHGWDFREPGRHSPLGSDAARLRRVK